MAGEALLEWTDLDAFGRGAGLGGQVNPGSGRRLGLGCQWRQKPWGEQQQANDNNHRWQRQRVSRLVQALAQAYHLAFMGNKRFGFLEDLICGAQRLQPGQVHAAFVNLATHMGMKQWSDSLRERE